MLQNVKQVNQGLLLLPTICYSISLRADDLFNQH